MVGIFLSIGVAFLKALGELGGKIFTDTKKKTSINEYSLVFGSRFITAIILVLPVLYLFPIPDINNTRIIVILIVSSIFNGLGSIWAIKALKYGDISLVSPLTALTIPFLLLTSYYITGESPNVYGYIGVMIIFLGTYVLQVHNIKAGILGPIKSLFHNTGAKYMMATAIAWSITAPFDKLGLLEIGVIPWLFYSNLVVIVLLGIYMLFTGKKLLFNEILQIHALRKIGIVSILMGGGLFLQMLAMKYTLVVYVIAIKRASGIFSVIFGYIFYKEKNILEKLIAAIMMLLGVICIIIYGNI